MRNVISFVNRTPLSSLYCLLFSSTDIDSNSEQPENALSPIVLTLLGILIDVNDEQPENALLPIFVMLFGIFTDDKELWR